MDTENDAADFGYGGSGVTLKERSRREQSVVQYWLQRPLQWAAEVRARALRHRPPTHLPHLAPPSTQSACGKTSSRSIVR